MFKTNNTSRVCPLRPKLAFCFCLACWWKYRGVIPHAIWVFVVQIINACYDYALSSGYKLKACSLGELSHFSTNTLVKPSLGDGLQVSSDGHAPGEKFAQDVASFKDYSI